MYINIEAVTVKYLYWFLVRRSTLSLENMMTWSYIRRENVVGSSSFNVGILQRFKSTVFRIPVNPPCYVINQIIQEDAFLYRKRFIVFKLLQTLIEGFRNMKTSR